MITAGTGPAGVDVGGVVVADGVDVCAGVVLVVVDVEAQPVAKTITNTTTKKKITNPAVFINSN
jgi:hypothetical protein